MEGDDDMPGGGLYGYAADDRERDEEVVFFLELLCLQKELSHDY